MLEVSVTFEDLDRAKQLRMRGVSYKAIATAMDVFCGVKMHETYWRRALRGMGCPAYPRGVPFGEKRS